MSYLFIAGSGERATYNDMHIREPSVGRGLRLGVSVILHLYL